MTQEEIQDAIKTLWEADKMIPRTPEASRQFLIDAGIIEAPKKKKKAKRQRSEELV